MNDDAMPSERRCCGIRCRGFFLPFVLIALGVIFLLDQLNYINAGRVFGFFWPVAIIIFGLEVLRGRRGRNHVVVGVVALGVGATLLCDRLGYWNFDIGRLWPVILILIGLSLLIRPNDGRRRRRYRYDATPAADPVATPGGGDGTETSLDAVAVLGGYNRRITSQKFTGGRITAFFGGMQADLTQADIAGPEAVLEITAFMGGAELRVPRSWEIDVQGQPILGGFNDETQQMPSAGAKRLIIRGTAFMGGVNIKN
ncbi:MAG TPA: DUF5668 domain-containing protein [Terriglobales bacterium]|jgi:predicted membrane protein